MKIKERKGPDKSGRTEQENLRKHMTLFLNITCKQLKRAVCYVRISIPFKSNGKNNVI